MMTIFHKAAQLFFTSLLVVPLSHAAATYTTIDKPGADITAINGINNTSEMVGGYADDSEHPYHGFLLIGGNSTTVDPPGAVDTVAYGINDLEQIVGEFTDASSVISRVSFERANLHNS